MMEIGERAMREHQTHEDLAREDLAREELNCLRHKIAKIEKRSTARFDNTSFAQSAVRRESKEKNLVTLPAQYGNNKNNDDVLGFDDPVLDKALSGGINLAALTEFRSQETRQTGAASAFTWVLAQQMQSFLKQKHNEDLPILFISETSSRLEGGHIYPPGLVSLGINPAACLFIQPRSLHDALWVAELAAKQKSVAATILEVRGNPQNLDMAGTRRLHLRAQSSGRPFFLLRQAGQEEATAARLRFGVQSAPAALRTLPSQKMFSSSLSRPAFQITLEKSKNPAPQSFILEWNNDSHSFTTRYQDIFSNPVDFYQEQPPNISGGVSLSGNGPDQASEMGRILAFG
jgi:protein ImuA